MMRKNVNVECIIPMMQEMSIFLRDIIWILTMMIQNILQRKRADVYVSEIMGKDVKPDKKAIGEALDEYMEEQNDEDVRYSFHEFTVMDE